MTELNPIVDAVPTTPVQNAPPVQQAQVEQPQVQQQEQQQQQADAAEEQEQAAVTSPKLAGTMARVEYRDQNGNILDENLVASLRADGKVKFETRWEPNSRLENAHEIPIVDGQLAPQAPPHPDVEGQNPETNGEPVPPESPASVVEGNERSAEVDSSPEAKPASELYEATQ